MKNRAQRLSATSALIASAFMAFLAACSTEKIDHISVPRGVEFTESGMALVRGMAACGYCHGALPTPDAALSGGQMFRDLYGETEVPNITTGADGIGDWTTRDFLTYLRSGINRDGELHSQIPHRGMEWVSDQDLLSILAYLKSLPPAKGERQHSRILSFLDRNTNGFFEGRREVTGFVPEIPRRAGSRYGQYLVDSMSNCGRCHNTPDSTFSSGAYLGGGEVISNEAGEKIAPNITNSETEGIGEWTEPEIVAFLKSGQRPNGKRVDSRFCPIDFYRNASEQDLKSVAQYLKTVTPE